jgi:hypothetical protein
MKFSPLVVLFLAACAAEPLVIDQSDPLVLVGGPSDAGDEIFDAGGELADDGQEAGDQVDPLDGDDEVSEPGSDADDDATPSATFSTGMFFPDRVDVDRPVAEEEDPEPVPVLSFTQDEIGYYAIAGLAISRDGQDGMLGMSGGNSCGFDPQIGSLAGADFDIFGDCNDQPTMYDTMGRVMMRCSDDQVGFHSNTWGVQTYAVPGLLESVVDGDAFVTVEDNGVCQLSRRDHDGLVVSVELPEALCDGVPSMVVDEIGGLVYLANGDLYLVDDTEAHQIGVATGDLVAYDSAHDSLVTAFEGDVRVLGLSTRGAPLWRAEASGPVSALAAVGDRGAVFAVEEADPSFPDFVAYDGASGAIWGVEMSWPGLFDFSISADGTTMLAAAGDDIYTYTINVD